MRKFYVFIEAFLLEFIQIITFFNLVKRSIHFTNPNYSFPTHFTLMFGDLYQTVSWQHHVKIVIKFIKA